MGDNMGGDKKNLKTAKPKTKKIYKWGNKQMQSIQDLLSVLAKSGEKDVNTDQIAPQASNGTQPSQKCLSPRNTEEWLLIMKVLT